MSPRKVHGFELDPDEEGGQQLAIGMPPSAYSLNSDIARVADELIGRWESLGHLKNFNLAYLRRETTRTDNEFHVDTASGAFVRSDRERALEPRFDGGIWCQGKAWDGFHPDQRKAWVHSLLLRLGMSPKGALRRIRPDVNEWAEVARLYGAWGEQMKLFAGALEDHQPAGPKPMAAPVPLRPAAQTPPPATH